MVVDLVGRLEIARKELLDLTGRNRLLNTPIGKSRGKSIAIKDEMSEEVFRHLVSDRKAMTFLPGKASAEEDGEPDEIAGDAPAISQPDEPVNGDGPAERHTDSRLQTSLTSEGLQRRLMGIYYDARTYEEEQGVNILYLVLGFLKWYEQDSSDRERYAPLILVPVKLERQTANSRFRLKMLDEEITTNLSLQAKLEVEFGVKLPDLPDVEDLSPTDYFAAVSASIVDRKRWEVVPNEVMLGFFSFAKFLMYRDLDPRNWPEGRRLDQHALVHGLLDEGFAPDNPICGNDEHIDGCIPLADMVHVVDADSSQAVVIEEARRGRNLVIQGPPGTGKSQTIANLIAVAVKNGKKVLFVAEKMAALEVVKRRLDKIGLGDMCLELHSNKTNKKQVVQEIGRTLNLRRPKVKGVEKVIEHLSASRDRLNAHARVMHTHLAPAGRTPYQIIGELARLRGLGVEPARFKLEGAVSWTPGQFREKTHLLEDVLVHLKGIGVPEQHPWRGVMLDVITPMDVARLREKLAHVIGRLAKLIEVGGNLAKQLRTHPPQTAAELARLAKLGQHLAGAPAMDRASINSPVWQQRREAISDLIRQGSQLTEIRRALQNVVAEAAWSTDVSKARRDLAAHGRSWFRILNTSYRQAQALLRGLHTSEPPKPLDERVRLLDDLMVAQKAIADLDRNEACAEFGKHAFGNYWHGANSDWAALAKTETWEAGCRAAKLPTNFREIMSVAGPLEKVGETLPRVIQVLQQTIEDVRSIAADVQLDLSAAFGTGDLNAVPLSSLKSRFELWLERHEHLTKWIAFRARWDKLNSEGMADLGDHLRHGSILPEIAIDCFRMAYYEELLREAFRQSPEVAQFNGQSHEQVLAQFKELDVERIRLARDEVALAHHEGLPAGGGIGEIGVIQHEINKQRRHRPLRQLLKDAGHAVQAIKPVFMMSPISVAQFLEPGFLEFDLMLIDEASQVRPVDALGAVARAKQVVVVGDDMQLPPTRFFDKLLSEETSPEEDGEFAAVDLESILGLCRTKGMPQRMLRWHYRSRHDSLIAVSNHEFYDDQLYVVPSPQHGSAKGLRFTHVADGVFDRGGSATNRIEARAVARAVIAHARENPKYSLGVGAFSVAQRDAILDELELLRRGEPGLEQFFATGSPEPFFVKNLENIQGDEREVIFISIGYARDASGYMAMTFGPLATDGGERRLNVLISRARERCEVFSSITGDDIDLNRARSRGAQALKTFLNFAQKGLLDVPKPTGGDYGSDFEEEVARALRQNGFEVVAQVGTAGFYIDLAIRDPDCQGRYLLGIECDGAAYHSSRSARDRDRLREQVLRAREWIIHRIWSTDWFHRPEEQLRKTLAAIEQAKIEIVKRDGKRSDPHDVTHASPKLERDEPGEAIAEKANSSVSFPYEQASFAVDISRPIHEVPIRGLASVVSDIVEVEGPVHQEEIARRVVEFWGLRRTGQRITNAVANALTQATADGRLARDGEFFTIASQASMPIRDRSSVTSATLRRPEMLPPAEIRAALIHVLTAHFGAREAEALGEASRLLGFVTTGPQLRQVIARELEQMAHEGLVVARGEKIYPAQETEVQ